MNLKIAIISIVVNGYSGIPHCERYVGRSIGLYYQIAKHVSF